MKTKFIFALIVGCTGLFIGLNILAAGKQHFPIISDFRNESADKPQNLRLLLVSQSGCIPCEVLRNKILLPLEKSKKYRDTVLFREISMDDGNSVIDTDGSKISTGDFLERYDVKISPALLFFDGFGNQVHDPMIGLGVVDFYSFYVEKAIDKSLEQINKTKDIL